MNTAEIRYQLDNKTVVLTTEAKWGAGSPESRVLLRAAVSQELGEDFSDLTKIPNPKKKCVSIAHCEGLGGFVIAEKPTRIGLDIEIADRVSEKVAARISTPSELNALPTSMPRAAFLWSAKEAVFKSLFGPEQPAAASEISIHGWQTSRQEKLEAKTGEIFTYYASLGKGADLRGKGVAFREDTFVISIFCLSSST